MTHHVVLDTLKSGLRKSRYKGTNRGTKGTVVNQTLLLLPRFPYKNKHFARYLDFRIGKNGIIEVHKSKPMRVFIINYLLIKYLDFEDFHDFK